MKWVAMHDRSKLDKLQEMVRLWVVTLSQVDDKERDAVDFVCTKADLVAVRDHIHRERSALMNSGMPHDDWTIRWSGEYVLPKLDVLIGDQEAKRNTFATIVGRLFLVRRTEIVEQAACFRKITAL